MQRFLALLLVLFPVALSSLGIKLIRDTLFFRLDSPIPFFWLQFLLGILFLISGLSLIGGFVFYRDKKRSKVQSRFVLSEKGKKPPFQTDRRNGQS